MSWAGSSFEPHLYVSATALAFEARRDAPIGLIRANPADVTALLRDVFPRRQGLLARRTLRVWLSGALCRAFTIPVPAGHRGQHELMQIGQGMAPELTGLEPPLRVWVDPRPAPGARAGAAVAESTLAELLSQVAAASVKVAGVAPWWSAAQRAMCTVCGPQRPVDVGVVEADALTLLRHDASGSCHAVTWAPLRARGGAHALLARHGLDAGTESSPALFELHLDDDRSPEPAVDPGAPGLQDLPFGRYSSLKR